MTSQVIVSNREPSVMEVFILALIGKAGLTSLYAFQQQAGLQPGGIRPALERLEKQNLIERAESASRQKRNLSLTDEGSRFLNAVWKECLGDHSETEAVLRAVCIALLMGAQEKAAEYLQSLATTRRYAAEAKSLEAEQLGKTQKDPMSTYTWMRALTEARRRSAESEAFLELGQYMGTKK